MRWLFSNIPNAASILGVLPIVLLGIEDGARFLIPLLVYNNIMDDLDGQLAVKLDLKSGFGAALDNVCDAVAHVTFVMFVGLQQGAICLAFCIVAAGAILLRATSRVAPPPQRTGGTATNELMRHIMLVLIASATLGWKAQPFLIAVLALNTVSMLVPFSMPHLIRSRMKTATGIALVNAALVLAWWIPATAAPIALIFGLPYLYSLFAGGRTWLKRSEARHT